MEREYIGTKVAAEIYGTHSTHVYINGPDAQGETRIDTHGAFSRSGVAYLTPDGAIEVAAELTRSAMLSRTGVEGLHFNFVEREAREAIRDTIPAHLIIAGEGGTVYPVGAIIRDAFMALDTMGDALKSLSDHIVLQVDYDEALSAMREEAARVYRTAGVVGEIAAERARQVEVKGYTAAHDDGHPGEMALAASAYVVEAAYEIDDREPMVSGQSLWPWEASGFKHEDARSSLVTAGALIVAEIERLDRAKKQADEKGCHSCKHMPLSGNCAAPGDAACWVGGGYVLWEPKQ